MFNKLKAMAIFAEVAHLGSFRAAAESKGVSPSVVSQQISGLEESLGETLLNRSTRNVALTSVGESFLVHCDAMLKAANLGVTSVMQSTNQGSLRITLPMLLAVPKFGRLIERYQEQNPLITLSMKFDDGFVDSVEKDIDIALRLGLFGDLSLSLRNKKIANIPRVVVCSPSYLSQIGPILSPRDLNRCCWIGRKNPSVSPNWYNLDGEMYTVRKQPLFIQVNNIEAMTALVLADNGVALLPEMLVEQELVDGTLISLLPDWQLESLYLYTVWSEQRITGQLVRNFVDFIAAEFVV